MGRNYHQSWPHLAVMIKILLSIISEASDLVKNQRAIESTLIQVTEQLTDIDELLTEHSIKNKN